MKHVFVAQNQLHMSTRTYLATNGAQLAYTCTSNIMLQFASFSAPHISIYQKETQQVPAYGITPLGCFSI